MKIDKVKGPKSWGVIALPDKPGHYHTGYVGQWANGNWRSSAGRKPEECMVIGENVVITHDFKIDSMSRGRSAANFSGHFRGHEEVSYEFGMQGTMQLIELLQSGAFWIVDGYIVGRWTFAKQGSSMFLKPYVDA